MSNQISVTNPLKIPQLWLLGTAAGLSAIYFTLLWQAGDVAHLGMSALFGLAAASLLWDKRYSLKIESKLFSSAVGALLIAFVLWRSAVFTDSQFLSIDGEISYFLRLFPFIASLALGLLASGFKGLKQYWQELLIFFVLGAPSIVLSKIDISPLTARFSTFLLQIAGFDAIRQGVYIHLWEGSVKVYSGCSGMESITYLLGLAVVCLVMFPLVRSQQVLALIAAVLVGFVVNSIRVNLMTVLIAANRREAFKYWHEGDGSLIFGMIAVVVFGLFYLFLIHRSGLEPES